MRTFVIAALLVGAASCSQPGGEKAKAEASVASSAEDATPNAAPSQSPVSFLVRFKAPHPMASAQDLEGAGRCEEAQRRARETLASRPELAGLCFDRFTVGGAEVVLNVCAPVAPADARGVERSWLARLTVMDGVEYAEPNHVVTAAGCQ